MDKECTKRNILYKKVCISCEKKELERLQEKFEDEKEVRERMKKAKIPRYIGKSSK